MPVRLERHACLGLSLTAVLRLLPFRVRAFRDFTMFVFKLSEPRGPTGDMDEQV